MKMIELIKMIRELQGDLYVYTPIHIVGTGYYVKADAAHLASLFQRNIDRPVDFDVNMENGDLFIG